MKNAGKYNKQITILQITETKDAAGFPAVSETVILKPWANVKTTKGFTLIANGSDFEKALTNFTIRYPVTVINRDMIILFNNKRYSIEYLNNVNEQCEELEIQAKEVTH